jgi:hypothetical protein
MIVLSKCFIITKLLSNVLKIARELLIYTDLFLIFFISAEKIFVENLF